MFAKLYKSFTFLLLILGLYLTLAAADPGDENHLFFNFPAKSAPGWEGLEQWQWISHAKNMVLDGVPMPEGQQVLTPTKPSNRAAILTSPLMKAQSGVYSCLYFYYYVRVPNDKNYGLTVSTVSPSGSKKQLWGMSRQDYDIWEVAEIQIDWNSPVKIQFSANQSANGMIALNGFYLRDGKCPDVHEANCNFESDGLCKWTTTHPIYLMKSGLQKKFTVKPEDHTTDSLFGHTAVFIGDQHSASLISPIVKQSYHKCMSLAFMQNAPGISLEVLYRPDEKVAWKRLWNPTKSYKPNQWHLARIQHPNMHTQQFMINFTNYDGRETNAIQIDDIEFKPYCMEDVAAVFKYGLFEWGSPKTDKHRWQIGTGRLVGASPNEFIPQHPVAVYTDFSTITGKTTQRLVSDSVETINFFKCVSFDFQVIYFESGNNFTLDVVFENGKRSSIWNYNKDIYETGRLYLGEKVAIPSQFEFYHLEFVAESEKNKRFSVAIIQVGIENSPLQNCKVRKPSTGTPATFKPTVPPTSAPQRKTHINPSVRALVNALLKNVRTEVSNILRVIADKNDILYELVGDVDNGVDKAIRALTE